MTEVRQIKSRSRQGAWPAVSGDNRQERGSLVFVTGLLLGIASGTVGVTAGVFQLRLWHMLLCIAFFLAVWHFRSFGTRPVRLLPHDFLAVCFVLWGLISEYVNSSDLGYEFTPISATVASLFLMAYWAVRLAVDSKDSAIALLKGFTLPTLPLALVAAAQAGSSEVSRFILLVAPGQGLANRVADGRLIRATGFVGHWTGLGFFFCAMLAASVILILLLGEGIRLSTPVVSAFSALVGAFASLTLAAILTACAILLAAALVRGLRLWPTVGITAGLLATWYYFGDLVEERVAQQVAARAEYIPSWVPNTIAFRYKIWTEQTIPVVLERPFWGWGNNLYSPQRDRPYQLSWISAESQWLAQWINASLVSMLLLLLLVGAMLVVSLKLTRAVSYGRSFYPLIALVAMTFLSSFTASVFTNRGLTIPLWVLFGLACALLSSQDIDTERSHAARSDRLQRGRTPR